MLAAALALSLSLAHAAKPETRAGWRSMSASDPARLIRSGRELLDAGRFTTDASGERELLWWMGHAAANVSDATASTEVSARLESLGSVHGDEIARAYAGFLRADIRIEQGDPTGVAEGLRAAARLQANADPAVRALMEFQLCDIYTMSGDNDHALPLCRKAEASFIALHDDWNLAQAENNEGVILFALDRATEAAPVYERAMAHYRAVGDAAQAISVGDNLARAYLKLDRANEALALSQAALESENATGRVSDALLSRGNIARAYAALGRPQDALRQLADAIAVVRETHKDAILVDLLETQSTLAEKAGDLPLALASAREMATAQAAAQGSPGVQQEEQELATRYAARENELRIRDLERDNQIKDLELKNVHADTQRRESLARQQRLTVAIIGVIAFTFAIGAGLLWQLLRVQRRSAAVLRAQASLDPLTGVENRRGFYARMHALLARPRRPGESQHALMLIDLDNFKRVNDNGGHPFGDLVLTTVVECLRRVLGERGTLARLGGEEFVALCPECGGEASLRIAETMRAEVANLRFPLGQGSVGVTISIGLALFDHERNQTAESWLRSGDDAMYAAKAHGRNRVVASAAVR
jgi:diguanylate cyclase (GGDEF)-like protein